jgi:hypothetical protein
MMWETCPLNLRSLQDAAMRSAALRANTRSSGLAPSASRRDDHGFRFGSRAALPPTKSRGGFSPRPCGWLRFGGRACATTAVHGRIVSWGGVDGEKTRGLGRRRTTGLRRHAATPFGWSRLRSQRYGRSVRPHARHVNGRSNCAATTRPAWPQSQRTMKSSIARPLHISIAAAVLSRLSPKGQLVRIWYDSDAPRFQGNAIAWWRGGSVDNFILRRSSGNVLCPT